MENLKITVVQPDIIWEDPKANLKKYKKMLASVESTDVIVFPEMFTTGFSMKPEKLKDNMTGPSVLWMKELARERNASVTASLIIEDNGKMMNRALWVFPNEEIEYYDKRHLYTMGKENQHYSAGKQKRIVKYKGWRFCPLICYDLRFPVWSRNNDDYDVLIYMANWPSPRHHVWKILLKARAIENQSYCVGVNRVGRDETGLQYLGDSAVVDAKGYAEFSGENETIRTFELSYSALHQFRKSFPLLSDKDEFHIIL